MKNVLSVNFTMKREKTKTYSTSRILVGLNLFYTRGKSNINKPFQIKGGKVDEGYVKRAEIHARLQNQFEEETLTWPPIKMWCSEFKQGSSTCE